MSPTLRFCGKRKENEISSSHKCRITRRALLMCEDGKCFFLANTSEWGYNYLVTYTAMLLAIRFGVVSCNLIG